MVADIYLTDHFGKTHVVSKIDRLLSIIILLSKEPKFEIGNIHKGYLVEDIEYCVNIPRPGIYITLVSTCHISDVKICHEDDL